MTMQITGKKGGGSSTPTQRVPVEEPNTLQSKNVIRLVDVISEGEIGQVPTLKELYLDGTVVQNADNSVNFRGVSIEAREGLPDQEHLAGFPFVETEFSVGVEVTNAAPIVRTIEDADIDAVRIKVRIPNLSFQNTSSGDLGTNDVKFKIEYKPNGGSWISAGNKTIAGKTTSPYERQYRVKLTGSAPWDIRVSNQKADSTGVNDQRTLYWSSYTKIIDNKLVYPDTALVGVTIDASLFGTNLPNRAYEIKGIKVKIPSNYNPITRVYTGIWDGTFTVAWTDNPAWILFDLMIEPRYGLGDKITIDKLDKYSFYDIGVYCDEFVDDGFGGTEPRFVFNGVINTRDDAYNVLNSIASNFRGMLYYSSGLITPAQDSPKDPIKNVTVANVIGGEFNYSGSGLKARHTVVFVRWNDPNEGYKPAIEVVEDLDGIARYGRRQKEISAYGCTSRGQANRQGKWVLDTEQNETETLTYRASLDHMDVRPGDIIAVQDPSYANIRFGGRVNTATTTEITIDDDIIIEAGKTYSISVMLANGTTEEREITNSPSTTDILTLSSALSSAPKTDAVWLITASDVSPRLFRIIGVRESEKNIFEVTALYYDATKYARVEQDIIIEEPDFTTFPTGPILKPTNITAFEYVYRVNNSVISATTLSWEAAPDTRVTGYEVEVKRPDSAAFENVGSTSGISLLVDNTPFGEYEFRVRAYTSLGQFSEYETQALSLLGLQAPPSDVENFNINTIGDKSSLTWDSVPEPDLDHYVIKFSTALTGATWGSSQILFSSISKEATSIETPTQIGTYLIKAVDVSSTESVNATLITTSVAAVQALNVVAVVQEDTAFSGTKENVAVDGVTLRLNAADSIDDWADLDTVASFDLGESGYSQTGTYYFNANAFDLGAGYTSRLTADLSVVGLDFYNTVDEWADWDSVENIDGTTDPSLWNTELQLRTTDDDPVETPTWGDWKTFVVGDYTARAFEFRLLFFSYQDGITPVVSKLRVNIDMPDRVVGDNDITCTTGGISVTFSPSFKAKPSIAIGAQDMATGDYYTMTNQDADGFDIEFFNSSATSIERVFDYVAKGYGVKNV